MRAVSPTVSAPATTTWAALCGNTYFGPSRFEGKSYYQGSYASGQNENNYSFFSAGGMDFILINLQITLPEAQLDWADALLKANPSAGESSNSITSSTRTTPGTTRPLYGAEGQPQPVHDAVRTHARLR